MIAFRLQLTSTTAGEEAFRATALRPRFGIFHDESSPLGK